MDVSDRSVFRRGRKTGDGGTPGLPGRPPCGLTLVEAIVGAALLIGGSAGLLMSLHVSSRLADHLSQLQVALNAVDSKLQELSTIPFDTLWTSTQFAAARRGPGLPDGQCMGLLANTPCNDPNGPLPGGNLIIQIRQPAMDFQLNPINPSLLEIHVAACWTAAGGRRIGEDVNGNGQLDPGEDANNVGWIDSPAMASLVIGRK